MFWLGVFVLTAFGGSPETAQDGPQPDLGPPLACLMSERDARFRVPVVSGRGYRWWSSASTEPFIEYGWLIELSNGPQTYRFGFVLWSQGDQPTHIGGLTELLAAGEQGVWQMENGEMLHLPELSVSMVVQESILEIVVEDPATFAKLLGGNPGIFRIIEMQMRETGPGERVSHERVRTAVISTRPGQRGAALPASEGSVSAEASDGLP